MQTRYQPPRRPLGPSICLKDSLSPKKTAFIVVIIVGCIAILWPRVFHSMMFGGSTAAKSNIEEPRLGGCCDFVLDSENFLNKTLEIGPQLYRRQQNFQMSARQERPPYLHSDSIYQAMRERGRAIPAIATLPIIERKISPSDQSPRIVEGRPGPIPGMRPPLGAGSLHQPQAKGNSMGFIMPLYTIGIILFFGYTIVKVALRKSVPNAPYGSLSSDSSFRNEVFGREDGRHVESVGRSRLGLTLRQNGNGSELYNESISATTAASNLSSTLKRHQQYQQKEVSSAGRAAVRNVLFKDSDQLTEIQKLRKKLEDTEKAMAKLIAEMNSDQFKAKILNEDATTNNDGFPNENTTPVKTNDINISREIQGDIRKHEAMEVQQGVPRDGVFDKSITVLGMELTACWEGGLKWIDSMQNHVLFPHREHSKYPADDVLKPEFIYLEGALAHDSQILVTDSETKTETLCKKGLNGSLEEPTVILSSKMTLSLISLDGNEQNDSESNKAKKDTSSTVKIENLG